MNVKSCDKLEKSMVELTVEVGAADFEAAIEKAYKKQRGQIRMPGFRPGKAPRKIIERTYGEGVFYEEAVNIIWPDAYEDAVKEQELTVVGYPKIELLDVGKEGFSFKAVVAVYPEVTLGQYKGIEAPKSDVQVTDADVETQLAAMADRNSRLVDQDRAAQTGDIVSIDFKGYLNGKPFEGGEGMNYDLTLGSGQFIPGFEEQVAGMETGEERDIKITFPEDYHPDLANQTAVFHVKVNAVKVKEVPALDDEFAIDVSEFDTLEELKEDVRAKLVQQKEEDVQQEFENVLMDKIADGIEADIPDDMVTSQAKAFAENFVRQLRAQGMTMEQYTQMTGTTFAALKEKAKEPALHQVRLDLAIAAIIKEEGITVSDEEVAAEYQQRADEVKIEVEKMKKYIEEPVIREHLLSKKAVALVVDNAVAVKPGTGEEPAEEPEN